MHPPVDAHPLRLSDRLPTSAVAEVRSIEDRSVVWVEYDIDDTAPRLASGDSTALETAARVALDQRLPLVIVIATSGVDIVEGMAALDHWGRASKAVAACSGIVPTFVVVDGPAVSGPALLLGIADFAVMTESSAAFVNGPVMVEQFTGIAIDMHELGGADNLARYAGVPSVIVGDRAAAEEAVAAILAYLPSNVDELPPRWPNDDPPARRCPEAGEQVPASSTGSYDVRKVAAAIVDDGIVFEVRGRWAANLVTAFATIDGRPVGIVANQPMSLAGTLDIPASQKAARFVAFCDAFNIPLLTLVDTPGFYPGKDLEWRGMIRHGAQLVFAYARASVPRVCVILRKSYGGAYIVMDSKTMGNDLCLAWPWAELAVMGAGQAAAILRRGATPDERAEFELDYAERLLNPYVAAERGLVDAVVDPADTRAEIAAALAVLEDKREALAGRKHGNSPL